MIIKAKVRGNGRQLGAYLLRSKDNEHVSVHDVRGFVADDLLAAMSEADAVAKGTRCQQHLFSISLNPPPTAQVRTEAFEHALALVEERTGLGSQPRVVVFHEKEGRRHCHAVWSRIDAEHMRAVDLAFFKLRMREVSKQLFLENGHQMPRGLIDSKARDPRNFDHAEWQQAKRLGHDRRELKAIVQECWAFSDSGRSFASALEERGLYLAKGDRRAFVALTYEGEPLSVRRLVGKTTKEVTAKLGQAEEWRSVDETRAHIAEVIAPKLQGLLAEVKRTRVAELSPLDGRRVAMQEQHARERERMNEGQRLRAEAEGRARAERMRSGVMGLWDRVRGVAGQIKKQNELEAFMAFQRDREQRHALLAAQLAERQRLQDEIRQTREQHALRVLDLHRDLARQRESRIERTEGLSVKFREADQGLAERLERLRQRAERGSTVRQGPELER